jgi:hypothetical protein
MSRKLRDYMPNMRAEWMGEHMGRYETGAVYCVNHKDDINILSFLYDDLFTLVWTEDFPNVCTIRRKDGEEDMAGYSLYTMYFDYVEFCTSYKTNPYMSTVRIPCISDFIVGIQLPDGVNYDIYKGQCNIGKFSENNMMIPNFSSFADTSVVLHDNIGDNVITVRHRCMKHSPEFKKNILYQPIHFKNDDGIVFALVQGEIKEFSVTDSENLINSLKFLDNTTPHSQHVCIHTKLFGLIMRNIESKRENVLKNYTKILLNMRNTDKILISIWSNIIDTHPNTILDKEFSIKGNLSEMLRSRLTTVIQTSLNNSLSLHGCLDTIPMLSDDQATSVYKILQKLLK